MIKDSSAHSGEILSAGVLRGTQNADYARSRLPASGSGRGFDSPHLHRECRGPRNRRGPLALRRSVFGSKSVSFDRTSAGKVFYHDLLDRLGRDFGIKHRPGIDVERWAPFASVPARGSDDLDFHRQPGSEDGILQNWQQCPAPARSAIRPEAEMDPVTVVLATLEHPRFPPPPAPRPPI